MVDQPLGSPTTSASGARSVRNKALAPRESGVSSSTAPTTTIRPAKSCTPAAAQIIVASGPFASTAPRP